MPTRVLLFLEYFALLLSQLTQQRQIAPQWIDQVLQHEFRTVHWLNRLDVLHSHQPQGFTVLSIANVQEIFLWFGFVNHEAEH